MVLFPSPVAPANADPE
jgi:H+/gluconate symporter-like permease